MTIHLIRTYLALIILGLILIGCGADTDIKIETQAARFVKMTKTQSEDEHKAYITFEIYFSITPENLEITGLRKDDTWEQDGHIVQVDIVRLLPNVYVYQQMNRQLKNV